jgi:uncharacterized phage-like protein YoqJ
MIEKMKTCCFTGHRPQSLPWGYNEHTAECHVLKDRLFLEIQNTIEHGYNHFIIGMALGIDTYVGEILIDLKRIYAGITIEAAIPCLNQAQKWPTTAKERYNRILSLCDKNTVISRKYAPLCMQMRNQYMIDQSSLLIAVWNGKPSGTKNTLMYAKQNNINVIVIEI